MHRLGGNSTSDKQGNKYLIRMDVYGKVQVIEFASRYAFLENYEHYNKVCPGRILSYSNTDSTNVNHCTPLPDDVVTNSEVVAYCLDRGYMDWIR